MPDVNEKFLQALKNRSIAFPNLERIATQQVVHRGYRSWYLNSISSEYIGWRNGKMSGFCGKHGI
jgi:hypothetical protein